MAILFVMYESPAEAEISDKRNHVVMQSHIGTDNSPQRDLPGNSDVRDDSLRTWWELLSGGTVAVLLLVISWVWGVSARRARETQLVNRSLCLSQQRLQYALEGSSLALWDYDTRSGEIYLSEQWAVMLGEQASPTSISHTAIAELIHPEDIDRVRDSLRAVLKGELASYRETHRVRAVDGSWKWIRSYGKVVERDASGWALRMTGTNADVTMQEHMQQDLQTSENRWQFALEGSGDGVWDWNVKTDEIFFSPRWKEMLGYAPDEIGNNFAEWESRVHPDDLEQCYRDLSRHYRQEAPVYENEQRMLCKDGSYKWILARGKVVEWDSEGKPVRVIGTHTDITEQRRVQETLRLQARAMEASVDGIVIADATAPDMPIVYCNSAFEYMTGYRSEEVLGRNCRFLQGEDLNQPALNEIRSAQRTGCATTALLRNYRKDGVLFWNKLSISPVHDENGRLTHFIGIANDVTARIRAEEALRDKSEFAGAVINAMPGAFFVLNKSGKILQLNENVIRITGFSNAELAKMGTLDFYVEEDRALISEKIAECCAKGEAQCEARLLTKDGEHLPFYFQAQLRVLGGQECLIGTGTDISNLKKMQQALIHSQSLLNTIVEHIPAMVFLKRVSDMSYVLLNKTGEEILEYKRDEVVGKTDQDLFSPEQAKAMVAVDRDVLASKQARVLPETHFRSRSGWKRYLYTVKTALYDEQGQPTHLLGISIDISDRKRVERRLRNSEEKLKEAQRIAQLGNWSLDMITNNLHWSDEIFDIFGLSQESYAPSYENFFAAVHPEDIDQVRQSEQKAMSGGEAHSLDHRIVRPDGEIRWVHEEAKVIFDAEGKPEKLVGTVQDITARKRIEQAVHYSEARLRTILETAVDAIIIIDNKGHIESVNPATEKLFGFASAEMIGRNVSLLMPEPYHSAHDDYLQRYQATGDAHIIGIGREVVGRRKDGSTFPMDLAVSEIHVGDRRMFTGFVRDISARKHTEKELLTAKEQAEQASRAKSEFLSNMSHELRTPMNAILGFAQLLDAGDPPLTQIQQQDVKEILYAGQHLLELINELLDLARIEAGRMEICIEPVPLQALLNECVQMIEPLLLKHEVSFEPLDKQSRNTVILADRVRMRQVLLNLLSNAIKYNLPGGTVGVSCHHQQNGQVRIEVNDTGIGIAPEKHPELFNSFSRLGAEETATEGTGIGLAITRRLVELMHGEVGVISKPGSGSVFWVELPSGGELDSQKFVTSEVPTASPQTEVQADYTVLYIEDNLANLRFMSHLLGRRSNLHLITATEPLEGLSLAETHKPDLILLDIHLPDMDGYEVFSRLQAVDATRHIPVIAVSANAMPEDIKRAQSAGFKDYCTKPLDIRNFLQTVDTILKSDATLH